MKFQHLLFILLILSYYLQSCQPSFEPINYDYSAIQAPLEQVHQAAETIKVDPSAPKVVHLKSGSSLSIPKDAFVDADGNTIAGEVELQYKQFDNAAEIVASGIPMTYQSEDGQKQQLQSGGMFELKGTANGKPVFIAPDKSIQTSLASEQLGDYDFYYLDPTAKNDQYSWEKLTNQVDIADSKKGVEAFELQFDTETTPELAALQGIQWQLADKEAAFNPNQSNNSWVLQEKWLNVALSQPQYKVNQLHFINKEKDGRPSLTEKDLIEIADYSSEGATYQYDWEGQEVGREAKDERIALSEEVYFDYDEDMKVIVTNKQNQAIELPDNLNKLDANEETHQLVYIVFNESNNSITQDMIIADKDGNVQHTVKDIQEGKNSYHSVYVDARPNHIILSNSNLLKIYDWEGKLLHKIDDTENYLIRGLTTPGEDHYLLLLKGEEEDEENGNSIVIWNLETNKMLTPPKDYKAYSNHYTIDIYPDKGIVCYQAPSREKGYIWNFKKNTIKEVEQSSFKIFDQLDQYIVGRSRNGKYAFFDFDGNEKRAFDGTTVDRGLSFGISEDGERIVSMFKDGESKLYNSDFEVLTDFRQHDDAMEAAFFTSEKTIVTYNTSGQFFIWDYAGNLKREGQLDCQDCYLSLAPFDSTLFFSLDRNKQFKTWSPSGDLVYHFNNHYPFFSNPAADVQLLLKGGKYNDTLPPFVIANVEQKITDKAIYQLSMHSKTKTYYTYIYLDAATKRAYDDYQVAVQKKLQKQAETRETARKITRSFAIKNFGIYNWDKFYKVDEELLVKCEPKFNLPEIKNSAATLFLITGENRNTVIEYTPDTWDKFSFQPHLYNQLLAILPDGEIAIFSNEDFKKLDTTKIRAAGSHIFNMKKKGGVAALKELEKIMQINDTAAI